MGKEEGKGKNGGKMVWWEGNGSVIPRLMTHRGEGLEEEINEGGEECRAGGRTSIRILIWVSITTATAEASKHLGQP